jgi:hypothetical protein
MPRYLKDIERQTGRKIGAGQRKHLNEWLGKKKVNKLSTDANKIEYKKRRVCSQARFAFKNEPAGIITITHAMLFGADNFNEISKVSLPDEIADFLKKILAYLIFNLLFFQIT